MLVLVVMDVVFCQRIFKKLEPGSVIQGSLQWKIIIEDQCTFPSLTGMLFFVSVLHFVFVFRQNQDLAYI